MIEGMTTWEDVRTAAPDLALDVQQRFDAHGLAYLATLRRDGSPRISGIEPWFSDGCLWLGMMWQSQKALDLQRDPRCSMHSASIDKAVVDGDARISGRATEHTSAADLDRARAVVEANTGSPPPPGPMHLFSVDVTEIVLTRPENDQLAIRWWTPGRDERRVERT
jgi:hypothetical protein